ncbi:hypothetical protein BJX62DRAFT_207551 [Aspergillus germanicus]
MTARASEPFLCTSLILSNTDSSSIGGLYDRRTSMRDWPCVTPHESRLVPRQDVPICVNAPIAKPCTRPLIVEIREVGKDESAQLGR